MEHPIEVEKKPNIVTYTQYSGQIDYTGGTLKVNYNNGNSEIIELTDRRIRKTGFNNQELGNCYVTLIYEDKSAILNIEIVERRIEAIKMRTEPNKVTYIENADVEINLAGAEIDIIYDDGSKSVLFNMQSNSYVTTSGFDTSKVGINTVTIKYAGKTTTFNVEIVAKEVTSIEVCKSPNKVTYTQNFGQIDYKGGKLKINYNNGKSETLDLTNRSIIKTGFDNKELGTCEITLTYGNITTTFDVEIIERKMESIEMRTLPTKTEYIEGSFEELDLTGAEINANYNDGSISVLFALQEMSDITTVGFDINKVGEQTITLIYNGKETTFNITIEQKEITGISLVSNPDKLTYIQNSIEQLDLTGAKLKIAYNNQAEEVIDLPNEKVEVKGYDNSQVGVNTISLRYQGEETEFDIEIEKKEIVKLELMNLPEILEYTVGTEELDLRGVKLKATYNNGKEEEIDLNDVSIEGFNSSSVGKNKITIEYEGKTIEFEVTIKQEENKQDENNKDDEENKQDEEKKDDDENKQDEEKKNNDENKQDEEKKDNDENKQDEEKKDNDESKQDEEKTDEEKNQETTEINKSITKEDINNNSITTNQQQKIQNPESKTANKKLGKYGGSMIVIPLITIISTIGIYAYIRYRKIKF